MIHKIFSVYDAKTEAYLPPFHAQTVGQAERSFMDAVNSEGHEFNKHAADFTLFHIGEFDDAKGLFTNLKAPFSLGLALAFKRVRNAAEAA